MTVYIHALRKEGDRHALFQLRSSRISIHALREEGDSFPGPKTIRS